MKQKTLPAKYKVIADICAFPLMAGMKSKAIVELLDGNTTIQALLPAITLNTYTTDDIPKDLWSDDRLRISLLVSGREVLKALVNYVLLEKIGYGMGSMPPSKFFADFKLPIITTKEEALTFTNDAYDIIGRLRAACHDWGIYYRCNDLGAILENWWFDREKLTWRNENRKNDLKLIFR